MTEATESTPPPTAEVLPSVGERLLQARQSQGLSLGEMARQLKLSVKQVEALERDDYRTFPGPLWVRGFLRNYAKVLGLDAEALVQKAGLAAELPGDTPSATVAAKPATAGRERRRVVLMVLAFVVLGLFVLGLLGQRAGRQSPVAPPGAPSGEQSSLQTPAPMTPPSQPSYSTDPASGAAADVAQIPATPGSDAGLALPPQNNAAAGTETLPPFPGVEPGPAGAPSAGGGIGNLSQAPASPAAGTGAQPVTPAAVPAAAAGTAVPSAALNASSAPAVPTVTGSAAAPSSGTPGASGGKPETPKPASTAPAATTVPAVAPGRPTTAVPNRASPGAAPVTTPTSNASSAAGLTNPASTPAPTAASPNASAGAASTPAANSAASPAAAQEPMSAAATPDGTTATSAPAPAEEIKPRTIRFSFTQSVDLRVIDAEGKVLVGSLQAAGSERAVRGLPPFTVSVGNVHAVKIVYRGRELDLTSRGRTGPAKLTLK